MSEIESLRQQVAEKDKRIADLEAKVDLLIRQLYAPKSEKIDPNQLQLLLEGDQPGKGAASAETSESNLETEANDPSDKGGSKAKVNFRKERIPEHLPVIEEVLDPDCVRACPDAWRCIGEEISERLDYEPGRVFRRRVIRRKYVRRAAPEQVPGIAQLPAQPIERGIPAPGLLAQITVAKFCDHLPLYRQEQIFGTRHGVWLSRQSMARWMEQSAFWLQAIYRQMHQQMMQSGYLKVDETPVRYLAPGTGRAQQGYLWTYQAPNGDTLYDWHASRAHGCLEKMIPPEFEGYLHCDGYSAYRTFAQKRENIVLAGCWAHARRKFIEARSTAKDAWLVLDKIQQLYRIENELRESVASCEERLHARQRRSLPILVLLRATLETMLRENAHLPQSAMGKAIRYTLELWECLQVYTEHGMIEIDNNLVENAIRPTALGKKNWLFFGREETGWRSAVIYSILVSCKNHGVEPFGYLKEIFQILHNAKEHEVSQLLPSAWGTRSQEEAAA